MPARVPAVLVALLVALSLLPAAPATAATAGVHVVGATGAKRLLVDGKRWQVRGVTWGPPQAEAERWLPDVRRLGANTVRTWGVDGGTRTLLRGAAKRGMRVVVGHWLPHDADWVHDAALKRRLRAEVLGRVRDLRHERGVLAWGLGNEVMFEQSARGGSSAAAQRAAYGRFLDGLARAVHRADPDHPTLSVEAIPRDWRALARRAPHLDVIGVNAYSSVSIVDDVFRKARIRQPYLVTETGPTGSWEEAPDPAGGPADHGDAARAAGVRHAIRAATAHPGRSLGVVVFHYGTETDLAGVRFGLRTAGLRRAAWFAVQRAYRGATTQGAPVIRTATATSTSVKAGAPIRIRVAARDPQGDRVRWRALVTTAPWGSGSGLARAAVRRVGSGVLQVTAPRSAGVHRVVVVAADGHGNAGMRTVVVRVRAAS
ncbi:hypothetical protein [Amnibacterium endophyticum]|uniref:Glycoside hydrolase family 2 catalytic domain-containing protein n=1 Tax=Amnibacterium endophyticum TaxID=2109337 RepID=A0ABW4LC33_9MICO